MIGQEITIENHYSGKSVVINDHTTDPDNVIALQSFPTFDTGVRSNNISKTGSHGQYRQPSYYNGMSITLEGVIVGDNEQKVWDMKEKLDKVFKLPKKPNRSVKQDTAYPPIDRNLLRISFQEPDGDDVWVDATPIQEISYNRNMRETFRLDFQVQLRSNLSFLVVDPDPTQETTLQLGELMEGIKVPFEAPFDLSEEFVTGVQTITVDRDSKTTLRMNGSDDGTLINPSIINLTNDEYIKIQRPLSGTGEYFEINGLYETMRDQSGRNVQPYAKGDFVELEEGTNKILYVAESVIPS